MRKINRVNKTVRGISRNIMILALVTIIVVAVVAGAVYYFTQPTAESPAKILKIGVPTALTGGENIAANNEVKAAQLAVEEINAAGGVVVAGETYELQIFVADTEGTVEGGVAVTERLIAVDKVDVIVGYHSSTVFLGCMEICQNNKIPTVQTSCASNDIWKRIAANGWKYLFHFSPNVGDISRSLAIAVEQYLTPRTIVFLVDDASWAHGLVDDWKAWIQANAPNCEVVRELYVVPGSAEMTSEIGVILGLHPDVVATGFSGVNNAAYIDQAYAAGLTTKSMLVTHGDEFATAAFVDEKGVKVDYMFTLTRWTDTYKTALTDDYLNAFKAKFGHASDTYAMQMYDGMYAMKAALELAKSINPDDIVEALEKIDIDGVWGHHKFSSLSEGHKQTWPLVVSQILNKEFTAIWPDAAKEGDPVIPTWYKQ